MATSYTQRTIRELKNQGLKPAMVERFIPQARRKIDLFGIIDVLCLDPSRGVVGVQSTGPHGWATHVETITNDRYQETRDWLQTPGTALEIWAWRKLKRRTAKGEWTKQGYWTPRVGVVELDENECLIVREGG